MKMRETSRDTDKKLCVNNYLTWANQIRLLTLNFQQLSATIGQGLIAALLPVIQALNMLMAKLIQVAESFRNFFYALMGKKLKGSQKGIVNESLASGVADIGTAGDAAAGGLDNATGAAEDLRKALSVLPFDQLNQLTDNSTSGGSGGGGGGGTGGGVSGGGIDFGDLADAVTDLEEGEVPVNEWAERMRKAFLDQDWEKLGEEIAWGINKGLEKIYDVLDWNKVGPKIEKFMDAFTTTLNSLVDSIDWDLLGRDFGRGLNIITRTANSFLEKFDFRNLGRKLSTALRGALDEIDWVEFGNLLGNGFMVAWDILGGFVEDMSRKDDAGITGWQELGTSVAESLNGVFERIDFSEIASTISNGLNGAFQTVLSFATEFDWKAFADNVVNGMNTFIERTDWVANGQAIEVFLDNFFTTLLDMASRIDWEEFARGVGQFLSQIDWGQHLMQMFNILTEVIGGIWTGLGETAAGKFIQAIIVFKVGTKLMPFIDSIASFFTGTTVTDRLKTAIQTMIGSATSAATAAAGGSAGASAAGTAATAGAAAGGGLLSSILGITGAVAGIVFLTEKVASLVEVAQGGNGILSEMGATLHDLGSAMQSSGELTTEQTEELWDLIETCESAGATNEEMVDSIVEKLEEWGVSADTVKSIMDNTNFSTTHTKETIDQVASGVDNLSSSVQTASAQTKEGRDLMVTAWGEMEDALQQLSTEGGKFSGDYRSVLNSLYETIGSATSAEDAYNRVITTLENFGVPADEFNKLIAEDFPTAAAVMNSASSIAAQSISDLQEKFTSLGFSIDNGFIEKLKTKAPEMQESVMQTFQSLHDGIAVGAEQIQEVFTLMGLNIPTELATTFANMEPAVLSSTISLLSQVSNGQVATQEQLTTAFRNLGVNITNTGLIQTLASQEPNVQQSAIMLLAQLGEGVSLSENQLVYAFQSLGIGIANDGIIDTLANAEPSVQQQAINLLGQIQSAAATERQPLIDEFNSLGVGTINEGLLSTLGAQEDDVRSKMLELLAEMPGASMQRRREIIDELESLGFDAGAGLIDGIDAKERDVTLAGIGLSDSFIDGLKGSEGLDTGSPSKKTKAAGEDAGQGLINGAISKKKLIATAAETLSDTFLKPFNNLVNSMHSLGQSAISQYIRGFQSMHIPTPHMYVSSYRRYITGNSSFSIPNFSIDWYAVGGLFREATIAGIGEKGAEAVLPLTDRRAMGMIADSILNNASVGMDEEVLTNAVARGVAMAMVNNSGNQTPITVYAELKTENDEVLARAVTRGQQKLDYRMRPVAQT